MYKIISFLLIFQLLACQSEPSLITPESLTHFEVGDTIHEASLLAFAKQYRTTLPVFDTTGSYLIWNIPNEATKKSLIYLFTEDPPSRVEQNKETYYFQRRISIQHVQVFEHEQKDTWRFELIFFPLWDKPLQMRMHISQGGHSPHVYFFDPQPKKVWKVQKKG